MAPKKGIFGGFADTAVAIACIGLVAIACGGENGQTGEPDAPAAGATSAIPMSGSGYAGFAYGGSGGTVIGGAAGGGSGSSGGTIVNTGGGSGGTEVIDSGGYGGTALAGSSGSLPAGSGGSLPAGSGGTIAAGTGGGAVAGSGGQAGAGGAVVVDTVIPDRCSGDYSKTIMIGDSYLAWTGDITRALERYAGTSIDRIYYQNGAGMVKGINITIPDQFRLFAVAAGPIQTILMTGGGNDVLIGDPTCGLTGLTPGSICEITVNDAINASKQLMQETAQNGVQETIFFFYPHIDNPALNDVLDQVYPLARAACEDQQIVDCTFIDTRDACGRLPDPIGIDGIHPTTSCSNAIADLMWEAMEDNCTNGVNVYR